MLRLLLILFGISLCVDGLSATQMGPHGNPGHVAYGGLFRDLKGEIIGCFSNYVGIATYFEAGILAIYEVD